MNNVLLIISAVLLFGCAAVTITRQLHFLQLNSYYNSRFFDYFKDEFNMISVWSLLGAAIIINLAIFDYAVLTLVLTVIFSYYVFVKCPVFLSFSQRPLNSRCRRTPFRRS